MRRAACAAVALLASGAAAASAAVPTPIGPPAVAPENGPTVDVTPATPGAKSTVKLAVRHRFTCGRPAAATIAVTFPRAEQVPASIRASAVHVSAGRVKAVGVSGKTVSVSVAPAPAKGVTCMSIVVGKLTVSLPGLVNPDSAGTYPVAVRDGASHYTAHFQISS